MAGERTRERGESSRAPDGHAHPRQVPSEQLSARDIQAVFTGHVPAYTTLMTALERLQKKGDVVRSGDSPRKVRFRAARSGDEHVGRSMLPPSMEPETGRLLYCSSPGTSPRRTSICSAARSPARLPASAGEPLIATGSFLAAAVLILLFSPLMLTAGRWQVRGPRTALTLWFCAFFAGIGFAVTSAAIALLGAVGGVNPASSGEALVLTLVGWLSLGVLAAAIALVSASAEPLADSWREAVGRFAPAAVSREHSHGHPRVVRFRGAGGVCGAFWQPEIFLSTALKELLQRPAASCRDRA